jgi:hypothetical protein
MRIQRSVQVLAILTTVATLAACASYGREPRSDPQVTTVAVAQWDSGPLDREYAHERTTMDNRHQQEIANPRNDESSDQRVQRHATENQDLEARYTAGKASHSQALPPSDKHHDDKPSDKSHE